MIDKNKIVELKRLIFILLALLSYQAYSQTVEYNYSCGPEKSVIRWTESKKDNHIYLKTVQGNEIHSYVMTLNYKTLSWEYSNPAENTDIKVVLENGVYKMIGAFKSKTFSKIYTSKGYPWYQNIGFNLGYSMKDKSNFKFECIRPDNLKLYEMQAEAKEIINNNGTQEQRINIHLTGMLARFFGSDYYIDCSTRRFVKYKGVHGPPGTPETIITIK